MEAKHEIINGKGLFEIKKCQSGVSLTVRYTSSFAVFLNDELIGTDSDHDRKFDLELSEGDDLRCVPQQKSSVYSVVIHYLPDRYESNLGQSMLSEEEPMTMYEELAQRYELKFRALAEERGYDQYDDEDYEDEEEDQSPLSHHEVSLMVEELPVSAVEPEPQEEEKNPPSDLKSEEN
jgi:hypothetical protein